MRRNPQYRAADSSRWILVDHGGWWEGALVDGGAAIVEYVEVQGDDRRQLEQKIEALVDAHRAHGRGPRKNPGHRDRDEMLRSVQLQLEDGVDEDEIADRIDAYYDWRSMGYGHVDEVIDEAKTEAQYTNPKGRGRRRVADVRRELWRRRAFPREALEVAEETAEEAMRRAIRQSAERRQRQRQRKNPADPPQLRSAVKTFEGFHQYDHKDVGQFKREIIVPERMSYAGPCLWVTYKSDKWGEGTHDYVHKIESYPKVKCCIVEDTGKTIKVPARVRDATTLSLIGLRALGFAFEDGKDGETEAKLPRSAEWFWSPSAKALYCIENRSTLAAVIWGGKLDVEPRGIVG